jgi:serine/threonine protein kinase
MARTSSDRLALIFGVETWRGAPLLVMEYLAGGTLADRIKRGPVGASETLVIGSTLARGLQVLHDTGLLHRDIKPTNIAFGTDGAPKLLDFGLASLIDNSDDPCLLAGTPLYLAPELVAGGSPGPASDLWSLSIVLYEAIAGRHPFASGTVKGALRLVAAADVPDLRTIDRAIPAAIANLFTTLLARQPSERPGSAADLVDRLESSLARL